MPHDSTQEPGHSEDMGVFMLLSNSLQTNFRWKFGATKKNYSRAESCLWLNKAYQDTKLLLQTFMGLITYSKSEQIHRFFSNFEYFCTEGLTICFKFLLLLHYWLRHQNTLFTFLELTRHKGNISLFVKVKRCLSSLVTTQAIACKYLLSKSLRNCN